MDLIVTPNEAVRLLNGDSANNKASATVIRRQCADGVIANAEKVGAKWYINATREWPHLFGEEPAQPQQAAATAPIGLDTTLGELLQIIGAAMAASATREEVRS